MPAKRKAKRRPTTPEQEGIELMPHAFARLARALKSHATHVPPARAAKKAKRAQRKRIRTLEP
jgi:hypothetical protein